MGVQKESIVSDNNIFLKISTRNILHVEILLYKNLVWKVKRK